MALCVCASASLTSCVSRSAVLDGSSSAVDVSAFCPLSSPLLAVRTGQYSAVQYSTVQYSTVQYSTVQYSTVQYSTVQHDKT